MQEQFDDQEKTIEGLQNLDKILEHRSRLGICILLSTTKQISFSRFKELLKESDGNLGAHLRHLEDAEYIFVKKEFISRKPVSWYSLTAKGDSAVRSHLKALGQVMGLKL